MHHTYICTLLAREKIWMSSIIKFSDTSISFVDGVAAEEMAILVYQGTFSSACWPSMLVALLCCYPVPARIGKIVIWTSHRSTSLARCQGACITGRCANGLSQSLILWNLHVWELSQSDLLQPGSNYNRKEACGRKIEKRIWAVRSSEDGTDTSGGILGHLICILWKPPC